MSATIYVYVVLLTTLLACAAAAIEWGAQGRIAARYVWTAVIAVALVAPPAVFAFHAWRHDAASSRSVATQDEIVTVVMSAGRVSTHAASSLVSKRVPIRTLMPPHRVWRPMLSRAAAAVARAIPAVWLTGSLALVVWLLASVVHWRAARRGWLPALVDGVEVDVSPTTGPAVIGLVSQRIVLPEWATWMSAEHRALMLAHEREHIVARDPQRLAFAVLAIVLMPWNAALWWAAARLRRAIELDCDARVLRDHPDARDYGYLLLEVAARGRNTGALAVPLVGLLQLPSELELRLRAMSRPRTIGRRTLVAGLLAALITIGAAFAAPVPRLPVAITPARRARTGSLRAPTLHTERLYVAATPYVGKLPDGHVATVIKRPNGTYLVRELGPLPPIALTMRDTIPRSHADSVRYLAEQLAEQEAELERARARLDSTMRALRVAGGPEPPYAEIGTANQVVEIDSTLQVERVRRLPESVSRHDDEGSARRDR